MHGNVKFGCKPSAIIIVFWNQHIFDALVKKNMANKIENLMQNLKFDLSYSIKNFVKGQFEESGPILICGPSSRNQTITCLRCNAWKC